MNKEKLYRVECICKECGELLMGSDEKPHLTKSELKNRWVGLVMSAPLNAPKCPRCKYSTDRDFNAGLNYLIDNGENKIKSEEFFNAS